jgi:hypothetical protein
VHVVAKPLIQHLQKLREERCRRHSSDGVCASVYCRYR